MALTDKILYLSETKEAIKEALENKGASLDGVPFREYADAINELEIGSGGSGGDVNEELFQFYLDFYNAKQANSTPTFTFPRGVTSVGNAMFKDLTRVTRVVLTPDITTIQQYAFENSNIVTVEGGNIETIGVRAFYNADSLSTIDLSKVKTISSRGMYGCTNFTNNDTNILTLPEVTSLGSYALANMNLQQVYLPKIKTLEGYCMSGMTKLEYVEIGSDIVSIAKYSFIGSTNLDTIKIDVPKDSIEVPSDKWGAPVNATILWQGESLDDIVGSGLPCTYEVLPVDGASYSFELNENGYYESTNKGVGSSASVCKIEFYANGKDRLYFDCINWGENTYDYGMFSLLDTAYRTDTYKETSTTQHSFKEKSSSLVQRISYGRVPEGNHTIWVKYLKDSSGDNGNDSLQFKVVFE